jgi:predicted aconitase
VQEFSYLFKKTDYTSKKEFLVHLTDDEKAMLDGKEGPAVQKAMELLVKYAQALGAERLVNTNNVCGTMGASSPFIRELAAKSLSLDAVFSEFNLDCPEVLEIPSVKVYTCHLVQGLDPDNWKLLSIDRNIYEISMKGYEFCAKIGIQLMNTCTPYLVGNVPIKGEHCAWMESSAVVFCNAVLGARTNTEGRESAGAAMLTGKIPFWGYHIDENRLGTHLVEVEVEVDSVMDWGLLGYYVGEIVQVNVPVISGKGFTPNLSKLKHFGASAASSGGVEMYHIIGITPEATAFEQAFGEKKPVDHIKYGVEEKRKVYEDINASAKELDVDLVVLGCPHYSTEQLWEVCRLLKGRKVHENTNLWVFIPRGLKDIAIRNEYVDILEKAGGVLMTDTCPAFGRLLPKSTKVVATDSAKQAHYLPAIMGVQAWFGSTEECIEAALSGRWRG